jgi:hypothetical protein
MTRGCSPRTARVSAVSKATTESIGDIHRVLRFTRDADTSTMHNPGCSDRHHPIRESIHT